VVSAQQCPLRRLLQPVLDQEIQVVTLVQDPALDARVELEQTADLAILLGDELLVKGRDFDVEVERPQVEVGRETLGWIAVAIPRDLECRGFVIPLDLVEVEEFCELPFAVMCELDALVGKRASEVGRCALRDRYPSFASTPSRSGAT
jgi:hypothetical protein